MAEDPGSDVALGEAGGEGHRVEGRPEEGRAGGVGRGREEAAGGRARRPGQVRPEDRLELGPDGDGPVAGAGLEAPPAVGAELEGPAPELHVVDVEAQDLALPTPGEEEGGDEGVEAGAGQGEPSRAEAPGGVEVAGRVRDLEPARLLPLPRRLVHEGGDRVVARGDHPLRDRPPVEVAHHVQVVPDRAVGEDAPRVVRKLAEVGDEARELGDVDVGDRPLRTEVPERPAEVASVPPERLGHHPAGPLLLGEVVADVLAEGGGRGGTSEREGRQGSRVRGECGTPGDRSQRGRTRGTREWAYGTAASGRRGGRGREEPED